ncbi:MAG TPA: tripartite tricarboxylate transporter substrate binding protein [Burkholderiaceae bacterium]|nr:tripartite tricarboxylate transporter substrate binding protein [Burkholderiaceae bacterium]
MKRLAARSALACIALSASAAAVAQTWPDRAISLVVPFAAGSGTDNVARQVGQKLAERLGQPVVIENKPGASAQIAAEFVAQAKPDGYTLFMTTNTSHSANPSLFKNLRYDPIKDFTPVARTGELPFALAVNPSLPVNSTKELIDYAKANPGKISYATPNSTSLVASETIRMMAGIDIVGVQYKSSPQALTDLMGGQLQMYVVDFGSGLSTLRTDKVRTLAVTPARGSKILPDVPPIADALPGFDLTSWNGVFGPAGLPKEIVERLHRELHAVLADPEVRDKLATVGFEVWPSESPDDFASYVAEQLELWGRLIKQAGIEPR